MSKYKRLTKREGKEVKPLEWDGEILHRLAELEDKIENGTLIELLCKVGDTIYEVNAEWCGIWDFQVEKIEVYENFDIRILDKYENGYSPAEFGITLFTDKEEAKRKFEEIKRKLK